MGLAAFNRMRAIAAAKAEVAATFLKEAERLEAEKLEAEQLESQRLEAEKLDAEKLDQEQHHEDAQTEEAQETTEVAPSAERAIVNEPAIFTDTSAPEEAIPLPDGRSIPVMINPKKKA